MITMTKKPLRARAKSSDHSPTKALKATFDAAHRAGQRALKKRDFEGVGKAIERERAVIEQHHAHINRHTPPRSRRQT